MRASFRAILTDARDLIAQGWCQRTSSKITDAGVCYCATGAIDAAVRRRPDLNHLSASLKSIRVVGGEIGNGRPGRDSLQRWNDAPGRTQAEVLRVFNRALGYPV